MVFNKHELIDFTEEVKMIYKKYHIRGNVILVINIKLFNRRKINHKEINEIKARFAAK